MFEQATNAVWPVSDFCHGLLGQTYTVVYNLGESDGSGLFPFAGVTLDSSGTLYVTAKENSGRPDTGVVFALYPSGSGWNYALLHSFGGGSDGANPYDRVVFGPDGYLYGATASGAGTCQGYGCGTIFRMSRTGADYAVIYRFQGGSDGAVPYNGDLAFDAVGSIYGTTEYGGYTGGYCVIYGCGTVFKLSPSNGGWTHQVLYQFTAGSDGAWPYASVVLDNASNLYGASGPIYELSPSGNQWVFRSMYKFSQGQGGPFAGVILDHAGNLYGSTTDGGVASAGTVFELTPLGGNWNYSLLYSFVGPFAVHRPISGGPTSVLTMDAQGNLYGTTAQDGLYSFGSVFKLTRTTSGWTYTSLYDFCRSSYPCLDGDVPAGGVAIDAHGNLFGTTEYGGAYGGGVVWEITP